MTKIVKKPASPRRGRPPKYAGLFREVRAADGKWVEVSTFTHPKSADMAARRIRQGIIVVPNRRDYQIEAHASEESSVLYARWKKGTVKP